MNPLARRRALAHLTDGVLYLGIAAATVPVGVLVVTTTDLGASRTFAHLVSTVPPLVATIVAARAESGPDRATWGKRQQGLQVLGADGGALGRREALLRNTAKIVIPWQLGHVTAISAAWGGFEDGSPLTWSATIATYAVIGVYAVTVLRGSGRGPHDLLAGSHVALTRTAPA